MAAAVCCVGRSMPSGAALQLLYTGWLVGAGACPQGQHCISCTQAGLWGPEHALRGSTAAPVHRLACGGRRDSLILTESQVETIFLYFDLEADS